MLVRRLSNVMFENVLRNKSKNLEINSLSTYQLFVTYIVKFIMLNRKIGKILLKTCWFEIHVSFYIVSQITHLELWHKICQKNMSLHTNFVCLRYSKLFLAPPTKALIGIDEVKVCNSRWMSKFGAIISLSHVDSTFNIYGRFYSLWCPYTFIGIYTVHQLSKNGKTMLWNINYVFHVEFFNFALASRKDILYYLYYFHA